MNNNLTATPTRVEKIKKAAKKRAKKLNIPHQKALNIISKELGFSSFQKVIKESKHYEKEGFALGYPKKISRAICDSDEIGVGDKNLSSKLALHSPENYFRDGKVSKADVALTVKRLFENGINDGEKHYHIIYNQLAYLIRKKHIMHVGESLIGNHNYNEINYDTSRLAVNNNPTIKEQVEGYIYVAIGSFFQSVFYVMQDNRGYHPPFATYLSDFIDSNPKHETLDKRAFEILHNCFPSNDVVKIRKGNFAWGSMNGGVYAGRAPSR